MDYLLFFTYEKIKSDIKLYRKKVRTHVLEQFKSFGKFETRLFLKCKIFTIFSILVEH